MITCSLADNRNRKARNEPNQEVETFRFEKMWIFKDECENIMEAGWSNFPRGRESVSTIGKIKRIGEDLSIWNRTKIDDMVRKI